ncbi:MAG: DNA primase, partial [Parcubacteria group bacterium]|nr:DNA primase [Parcubacteria group bacterium]
MSSQVEQIKEKLGIVDVVSQYLKLEKAGSNFRARCPFHNEKTPSFFVSPTRNSYYCFGCNAKGDIFSFVEAFEGLDFVGALKVLGEKAGVQIVFENKQDKDERVGLYSVMEKASMFFEENLKKESKIQEYLKERGLEEKTITDWRIGYAPDSWSSLIDFLKKTHSIQEIEKVGLIKKKEGGSEYYDRFRGRIMFPIFDNSGRVVAFSGRIFKDDGKSAKYMNSPETVLFSKSKILYGYDRAKFSIRKHNFSIVVEGQMDLLMSHQAGFTNTVALSGTALTLEHIELLKRLSTNIVLAFDSDNAGVASSGKSAIIGLENNMDVKVAHLKDGNDPADVINNPSADGKQEWKDAIKNAKHIVEFSLNVLLDKYPPAGGDKRRLLLQASQTVLP